jgi:hypothetical protein
MPSSVVLSFSAVSCTASLDAAISINPMLPTGQLHRGLQACRRRDRTLPAFGCCDVVAVNLLVLSAHVACALARLSGFLWAGGSFAQVYTPWENLKKRDDMDVGQIGYKNMKAVRVGHKPHSGREHMLWYPVTQTTVPLSPHH